MLPRGLTARISGFHPGGPGSTPGVGILFLHIFLFITLIGRGSIDVLSLHKYICTYSYPTTQLSINVCGEKSIPLPGIEPGPPG